MLDAGHAVARSDESLRDSEARKSAVRAVIHIAILAEDREAYSYSDDKQQQQKPAYHRPLHEQLAYRGKFGRSGRPAVVNVASLSQHRQ